MGQIVGLNAKPKRANQNALSLAPIPASGEIILVSSDNSMNAAGQGNFDCYIVGNGTTAATALPLIKTYANDVDDVLTAGSDKLVKSGVVKEEFNQVTGKIEEIYKEETTITQTVVFSSGGEVTFDTIELSQDGDYIEFDVKTSVNTNQKGRAFCLNGIHFAIGLMNYICGLRDISNADIPGFSFNNGQHSFYSTSGNLINGGKVKVSYENGQIALYVKGVKVKETSSYAGNRPTIAINKMGSYILDGTTYYWEGTINEFHYHHGNVDINKLSDLPNFNYNSNVTVTTVTEHDESGLIPNLTQRVKTLEEQQPDVSHMVEYENSSETVETSITALTIGTEGFVEHSYVTETGITSYSLYDTYYFVAERDIRVYVKSKGSSTTFMRMVICNGTLQNHTYTHYANVANLPMTADNSWAVTAGQLVAISVQTGITNWELTSLQTVSIKNIVGYKLPEIEQQLDETVQRVNVIESQVGLPISIVHVSSTSFNVYVTNKEGIVLRYSFYLNNYSRTINDESILCEDVWNQEMIYRENTRIIQGNSNFIFAIDGTASGFENESSSRHAGPGHGCEVMHYVRFYADGVEINPTNLQETLKCNTFRFIQSSDVYAVDATLSQDTGNENNYPKVDENNNPVVAATHFIDMTLREDNDISIYNRVIIKRNGTVFAQLHGAMMQCYVPAFTSLLINDESDTLISVSAPSAGESYINHQAIHGTDMVWHSRKANIAVSHGDGVTIRQEMTSEDPSRYGKMYIYTVPYNDRFKCYFMPAKTTLQNTSDYETFNNGDIIEVNVHRKIDIV